MAVRGRLAEALLVGAHDLEVSLDREDERDIDTHSGRDDRGDGGKARFRRWDLDEGIRPIDRGPQFERLGDRRLGVVGKPWIDLDGDPTIDVIARLPHRAQNIACRADVVGGKTPDRGVGVGPAYGQGVDIGCIGGGTTRDRLLEDRRIRRDPVNAPSGDEIGKAAGFEPVAVEVIKPDRNSHVGEFAKRRRCGHVDLP